MTVLQLYRVQTPDGYLGRDPVTDNLITDADLEGAVMYDRPEQALKLAESGGWTVVPA